MSVTMLWDEPELSLVILNIILWRKYFIVFIPILDIRKLRQSVFKYHVQGRSSCKALKARIV